MACTQTYAAHAAGGASHRAHVLLAEAHRLALTGEQHDIAVAIGNGGADQYVALVQLQGPQTNAALAGEVGQRGLLHRAVGGSHEDVPALGVLIDLEDGGDALAIFQRQQVDHGPAAGITPRQRNLVHLEPVHLAHVGEAENGGVGAGNQQVLDEVLVLHRGRGTAGAAPALGLVVGQGLGLGIATVGNGHHPVFLGDQVFHGKVVLGGADDGQAVIAKFGDDRFQLLADHQLETVRVREDLQVIGYLTQLFIVLVEQLFMLKAGQAVQAQIENRLGLGRRQKVLAIVQSILGLQLVRAAGVVARALQHGGHFPGRPGAGNQPLFRLGGTGGRLDQLDDRVDIGQRYRQAFQQMAALAGLAQQVNRAPGHHLAAVADKGFQDLLQVQQLGLAVDQSHHIDAEYRLQLGLGVEVVEDHVADLAAAQFDHHPHTVLVGLIAQLGNALDLLFLHQLGDALNQARLVQLVGQLVNDDDVAALGLLANHLGLGAHIDAAATGAVGLDDAGATVDGGTGGEVRPRDVLHQLVDREVRVAHQRQAAADHFAQVVRRNIGRHANRDAGGAVDQQVGHPGGHDHGDPFGAVVVVDEVDGFLVQVRKNGVGDLAHADFGVTHGGRGVAVDGAEVALAVYQHVAHGKGLGHTDDGVVHRRVAVGMVLTDHVTHDTGRLLVALVPVVVELVHREQHPPVHRLEAIAHIRECAAHDHAHGVIEVGLLELVLDVDGNNFLG